MRHVGSFAYDVLKKIPVQILRRDELWGYVTYQVLAVSSKEMYSIPEDRLVDEMNRESAEDYLRLIVTHSKIRNEIAEGILSSVSDRVIPLPHQWYAVQRALEGRQIRLMLADEVGLGKTIEAGLILNELKARGLIRRVLVVCPKGLVNQWHAELKDKFHETFHVILPEDMDAIQRLYGERDIYSHFQQVISPLDAIKPLEKRAGWDQERIDRYNRERLGAILEAGWDLIIIDEAHRVAGSSPQVARYKLGVQLSQAAPYLLLLTATPHSGKKEPFLRLMKLLDDKAFPQVKAIVKEQVAPYIIRTEKRMAVDREGNRLFKDRATKVLEITWEERHSLQQQLYDAVTHYVRTGYHRAQREKKSYIGFLMVLMQRLATSSTAAIRDSLERRISLLENQLTHYVPTATQDWFELESEESLETALMLKSADGKLELTELRHLYEIAKHAEFQYTDAKAEYLLQLIDELRTLHSVNKLIIFTEFVATQEYLREYLINHGFAVSILNGSMDLNERMDMIQQFAQQTTILISTDAGGEGLNLQFSNVVINYDLPWNPMKIEQRIGRVDRIGQTNDVLAFHFILSETVENRVRKVLEEKLEMIFRDMGVNKMVDVLDGEMAELDFTNVYLKSVVNPAKMNEYVHRMESDIRNQTQQAQSIRGLISSPSSKYCDVQTPIGTSEMSALWSHMMISYYHWKGQNELPLPDHYDLQHPEIRALIEQDFQMLDQEHIESLRLPGLQNESGYWSLWELAVTNDAKDRRVLPVFKNVEGVNRPTSARRIWDALIQPDRIIQLGNRHTLIPTIQASLYETARDAAYDVFIDLKLKREQRIKEEFDNHRFALQLRIDAAKQIGLENIKRKRLRELREEELRMELEFHERQALTPVLRAIVIVYME